VRIAPPLAAPPAWLPCCCPATQLQHPQGMGQRHSACTQPPTHLQRCLHGLDAAVQQRSCNALGGWTSGTQRAHSPPRTCSAACMASMLLSSSAAASRRLPGPPPSSTLISAASASFSPSTPSAPSTLWQEGAEDPRVRELRAAGGVAGGGRGGCRSLVAVMLQVE